jgi:hypothetical protein
LDIQAFAIKFSPNSNLILKKDLWTHLSDSVELRNRDARWFVFKPKIQIRVNFWGLAMENLGIIYI